MTYRHINTHINLIWNIQTTSWVKIEQWISTDIDWPNYRQIPAYSSYANLNDVDNSMEIMASVWHYPLNRQIPGNSLWAFSQWLNVPFKGWATPNQKIKLGHFESPRNAWPPIGRAYKTDVFHAFSIKPPKGNVLTWWTKNLRII